MAEPTAQENLDALTKNIRSLENNCNDKYPSAERIELLAKLARENLTATEIKEATIAKLLKEMMDKRHPEAPSDKVDTIIAELTKKGKKPSDLSSLRDLKLLSNGDELVYGTGKELLMMSYSKEHMTEIISSIGITTDMNAKLAAQYAAEEERTKKEMKEDTSNDPELKRSFDSSLRLYRDRKQESCQDASLDLKANPNKFETQLQGIVDAGKDLDNIYKLFKKYGATVLDFEDRLKELEVEERKRRNTKPVA